MAKKNDIVYRGTLDTIAKIYKYEGFWAFYKGLGLSVIRVLPGTVITFGVYEVVILFSP